MDPISIIVNPVAGGGRALRRARAAEALLADRGHAVDLRTTEGPGHARALARAAVIAGVPRILACGGDGTLHEVAGGLCGSGTDLVVLPCGRGNDFAGALGLPHRVEEVVATMLGGRPVRLDLGAVNGEPYCTVAAIGFDSEVAQHVAEGGKRTAGRHVYLVAALAMLFPYRAADFRFEGDFGVREGRYLLGAAANTARYGAGVRIAPDARADDGLLDVCLVRDLPRLTALQLIPGTYRGTHVRRPEVEVVRTRELRVSADRPMPVVADGEVVATLPATLGVLPRALGVVLPG
ncbi:MAG TPA: diacylglycerol kinase family protein [Gemmatimonadales bacterium]|nr:diacylglycerol kinase family protein [Gemmatimonadales bacterium]